MCGTGMKGLCLSNSLIRLVEQVTVMVWDLWYKKHKMRRWRGLLGIEALICDQGRGRRKWRKVLEVVVY